MTRRTSKLQQLKTRADLILTRLSASRPNPRCELYYETPYQLLVSVVLSAQATDKSINACMEPLYKSGLGVDDVLAMGEAGFLAKIRSIGLAPTKAKNILKLSAILVQNYKREVPRTREELEALPGVGRKTANVILGEIYREPTLAVDTHVFRVTRRLGLQSETTPEKAEQALMKIIDATWLPDAHHWFILHGRYLCTARAPACTKCPLEDICEKIL